MEPINLNKAKELQLAEGVRARIINTATLTVAHVHLDDGADVQTHSHHNEQIVNVVKGELVLTVEGKAHSLTPGMAFVLPPNVPHSARAKGDCRVIDVFHPAREDFRGSAFSGYDGKE